MIFSVYDVGWRRCIIIHLIQDRYDVKASSHGGVILLDSLCLDSLSSVDDKDDTITGCQRPGDLGIMIKVRVRLKKYIE